MTNIKEYNDLSEMSIEELKALQQKVEREISKKREGEIERAREEVRKKADDLGISLSDLIGKRTKTRSSRPPKFRHPEDPKQTWTGVGRRPKWFQEQLDAGRTEDNMLIDKK